MATTLLDRWWLDNQPAQNPDGKCQSFCPALGWCCLESDPERPGHQHELHICSNPDCYCHSEDRYKKAKAKRNR